ncbi:hypothetical protein [Leptospira koniambonensis]|uniref:hypothetical protein n=1 Tax=Leptospira koniambonensis TaxID=2484950 RepID=UPI003EBF8AE1
MYHLLISFTFFFVIFTSCFQSSGDPQQKQLTTLAAISGVSLGGDQDEIIPAEAPKIEILSISPENYKPGDLITVNYKITRVGSGEWMGPIEFYLTDLNNCMEYCESILDTSNDPWLIQDVGNFTSYFNSTSWPYGNYNFSLRMFGNGQTVAKSKPLESVITHATASTLVMNGSVLNATISSSSDEKLFKLNVESTYKDFIIGISTGDMLSNVSLYPPGTNGSNRMNYTSVSSGSSIRSKGSAYYPQTIGNYEILASDSSGSYPISFSIQARNTHVSGGGSCNYIGSFFESLGCLDFSSGTAMNTAECATFQGIWNATQTCAQRNPGLTVLKKCTRFERIDSSNFEFQTKAYYSSTSNTGISCTDGI